MRQLYNLLDNIKLNKDKNNHRYAVMTEKQTDRKRILQENITRKFYKKILQENITRKYYKKILQENTTRKYYKKKLLVYYHTKVNDL